MLLLLLSSKIFLIFSALIFLIIGVLAPKVKKNEQIFNVFNFVGFMSTLIFLFAATIEIFSYYLNGISVLNFFYFPQGFIFDGYSYVSTICIYLISAAVCLLSLDYFREETVYTNYEFFILIILSACGVVTLLNASNFLIAYLGIELQSLPFYVLAAFRRFNRDSTEAGLKYFTLGGFSSALYLFGVSVIYGLTGTIDIASLALVVEDLALIDENMYYGLIIGLTFILASILFKLSLFPFHSWAPDVYSGSILPVVLLFATISKLGIFCFLTRLVDNIFAVSPFYFSIIFSVVGLTSIAVGTFGAMYQINIKKLLAYSTIAHMGYVSLAFSVIGSGGLATASFYIYIYILINLTVFVALIALQDRRGGQIFVESVYDLNYIQNGNVSISILFAGLFLSIAGVPPLLGFFSKYFVLFILINNFMYFTAILAIILSAVATYYYLRLVKFILFDKLKEKDLKLQFVSFFSTYFLLFLILLNIFSVFFVDEIYLFFTILFN